MIAIGRSSLLYNTIEHLISKGFKFDLIITAKEYAEYSHGVEHFTALAQAHDIPIIISKKIDIDQIKAIVGDKKIKYGITVNWQFLIPDELVQLCSNNLINLHLGTLPDYKGNATGNWAIIQGEKDIYVNAHKVTGVLDSGNIVARRKIIINQDTYIQDIIKQSESICPSLMEEALTKLDQDPDYYELENTDKGLRCFPRIPEDGLINWHDTAENIYRLIRASSRPYPGAYSFLQGKKVIIWKATPSELTYPYLAVPGTLVEINKTDDYIKVACADGILKIQEVECEGVASASALTNSIRSRFNSSQNT